MIVIPAIDIRGGRCVRLCEGRADAETIFGDDPVEMAKRWVDHGAERLHVVDLDGALGGPRQTALVRRIIQAAAPVPVQQGGGLRDDEAVVEALEAGARWIVLGTRAAADPAFLAAVCRRHPVKVIVAVDGRGSRVAVKGWTEVSDLTVIDLARQARAAGAVAVLYTDVGRDGTELGPNLEQTGAVAGAVDVPVLASGGVASVADLQRLATIPGVAGTIVGRALYTGAVDLRRAREALESSTRTREAMDTGGGVGGGRRGPHRAR